MQYARGLGPHRGYSAHPLLATSITPAPEPPPAQPSARRPEQLAPRRKQPEASPWSEDAAKSVLAKLPDDPKPAITVGARCKDPLPADERAEVDALRPVAGPTPLAELPSPLRGLLPGCPDSPPE